MPIYVVFPYSVILKFRYKGCKLYRIKMPESRQGELVQYLYQNLNPWKSRRWYSIWQKLFYISCGSIYSRILRLGRINMFQHSLWITSARYLCKKHHEKSAKPDDQLTRAKWISIITICLSNCSWSFGKKCFYIFYVKLLLNFFPKCLKGQERDQILRQKQFTDTEINFCVKCMPFTNFTIQMPYV